jgi:hypothetical protein
MIYFEQSAEPYSLLSRNCFGARLTLAVRYGRGGGECRISLFAPERWTNVNIHRRAAVTEQQLRVIHYIAPCRDYLFRARLLPLSTRRLLFSYNKLQNILNGRSSNTDIFQRHPSRLGTLQAFSPLQVRYRRTATSPPAAFCQLKVCYPLPISPLYSVLQV